MQQYTTTVAIGGAQVRLRFTARDQVDADRKGRELAARWSARAKRDATATGLFQSGPTEGHVREIA